MKNKCSLGGFTWRNESNFWVMVRVIKSSKIRIYLELEEDTKCKETIKRVGIMDWRWRRKWCTI